MPDDRLETHGQLLRRYRKKASVSQTDLAHKLDLPKAYMCNVEAGRKTPLNLQRCVLAADMLGCPLTHLIASSMVERGSVEIPKGEPWNHQDVLELAGRLAAMWRADQ
jgi:DNA-binding XRE family transcriptional regulator